MQATIWRIPKGGGAPQIWFQDSRFNSPYIGVNGLRISPDGTRVFVTVSVDMLGRASVYSLPIGPAKPTAAQMKLEHRFAAGELPDGIAFGENKDLYVSMASPAAPGVTILRPDGSVKAQIKNPALNLTAPFDGPANIAFDGAGRILMTNHAPVTGLVTKQFSIVDVEVGDNGWPLNTPLIG
jgi:sugar lactone lactonase YvrE